MNTETTHDTAWQLGMIRKAEQGLKAARELAGLPPLPPIVCLCGSTRFGAAFREANLRRTLAGEIVLSIGCDTKRDEDLAAAAEFGEDPEATKWMLDQLHRRKIDLADYVLVVSDAAGYLGESTRGEIRYAVEHGKPVRFVVAAAEERARESGLVP